MRFVSSRGQAPAVSLTDALFSGLAADGGLWCPERLEPLAPSFFARLPGMPPAEVIRTVGVHLFGDEIPAAHVEELVSSSLDFPIPLVAIGDGVWALELFHGPTLAFKDVGARFMARLMRHAVESKAGAESAAAGAGSQATRGDGETIVLVATSGDTGSAVARAFLGVPGFRVVVLFPDGRISEPQRKLITTLGGNVSSLAVAGSFDDCQRLVKEAFADPELRSRLRLASANSINVGRLLPQVLYYFLAVAQLPPGSPKPIIATPSGNFGNLTAGLYAKRLGLPVERFVAATNVNDVVPEYLETGVFRPRPSWRTLSNAMDVGNPSNFERIRALYGGDLEALRADLAGARFTDDEVVAAIGAVHAEHGYLLDPHTAVGWLAIRSLRAEYPSSPGIVLATAHPAKFPIAVEAAIGSAIELPRALRGADGAPRNHDRDARRLRSVARAAVGVVARPQDEQGGGKCRDSDRAGDQLGGRRGFEDDPVPARRHLDGREDDVCRKGGEADILASGREQRLIGASHHEYAARARDLDLERVASLDEADLPAGSMIHRLRDEGSAQRVVERVETAHGLELTRHGFDGARPPDLRQRRLDAIETRRHAETVDGRDPAQPGDRLFTDQGDGIESRDAHPAHPLGPTESGKAAEEQAVKRADEPVEVGRERVAQALHDPGWIVEVEMADTPELTPRRSPPTPTGDGPVGSR